MISNYRLSEQNSIYDLDMGSFWPRDKFWVIVVSLHCDNLMVRPRPAAPAAATLDSQRLASSSRYSTLRP